MVDKKQKKKDKKQKKKLRHALRRKAVDESSKKGQLPSSVQALLGYIGGGGPQPTPQQPINLQHKERSGVDSIETLSQIVRQQNMMNMSYMQNMEKLAFKNEIQEQLKKQGESTNEELKKQSKEQKRDKEEANQQLHETTERTIQQQRSTLMQKLAYERRHKNRSEKIQYLQDKINILDGSIKDSTLSDLRFKYSAPLAAQQQLNQSDPVAESMDASQLNPSQAKPSKVYDSSFSIDPASTARIVDRLPVLDPNLSLQKQLGDQKKFIEKQVRRQTNPTKSQ